MALSENHRLITSHDGNENDAAENVEENGEHEAKFV